MSFSLDFDESRLIVTVAASGDAGTGARLDALRALRMHGQFHSDYRILCNFPGKNNVPHTTECLDLGLTVSAYFRGQKIALLVNAAESVKLRETVSALNTDRVQMSVFNDPSPAMNWLLSVPEAIAA